MKHHVAVKFIAIVLAALALLGALFSGAGIITLMGSNLYNESVDDLYERQTSSERREFAVNLAHRYASLNLGGCPEEYLNDYYGIEWLYDTFRYGYFFYTIKDETGALVESTLEGDLTDATRYTIHVTDIRYRTVVDETERGQEDMPDGATEAPVQTDPTVSSEPSETSETRETEDTITPEGDMAVVSGTGDMTEPPEIHRDGYWDYETETYIELAFTYTDLPPYTVDLYLLPGAMQEEYMWTLLRGLWQVRMELFYVLGVSLLAFAVFAVYLCCAAGRRPGSEEIRPGGLNKLPLDLYTGVTVLLVMGALVLGSEMGGYLLRDVPQVFLPILGLMGYLCSLLIVGLLYACVAQFKTPGGYWWRHSAVGWCLLLIWRGFRWIGSGFGKIGRGIRRVVSLMPVIWQWLLTAAVMVVWVGLTFFLMLVTHGFGRVIFLLMFLSALSGSIGMVCYGGYCYGTLMKGAQQMAQGNLEHKIPTKYLYGAFRDFAVQLNALADTARDAAERQIRSERMRTELITNVSHDIKTPLTSIINYVDLLRKPHTEEEGAAYLEVLQRQSQRLKKLVDDLMEMSKASTGNMTVAPVKMDAAETINQVLGEFGDKLTLAELTPMFRSPEEPVYMLADGRLVWRVMSNLLSNAVKYALPGTRLYVDLNRDGGNVVISLKNISREALNVSADELLERFVRGDASRNTDGSGLGLNIARSLMEVQRGRLELLVDGDLFKVTLVFPGVE